MLTRVHFIESTPLTPNIFRYSAGIYKIQLDLLFLYSYLSNRNPGSYFWVLFRPQLETLTFFLYIV